MWASWKIWKSTRRNTTLRLWVHNCNFVQLIAKSTSGAIVRALARVVHDRLWWGRDVFLLDSSQAGTVVWPQ
jgi:hypothetical protein